LSSTYLAELLEYLKDKDFCVNVISKSGTTTEPAIAFRFIKELMDEKYTKEEQKSRIFATTDKQKGALKELSDINGYETFVVPDDIGGRFSVLTSVGLLPLCVKGLDIDKLMMGASNAMEDFTKLDYESNFALQYASFRNNMYRNGKDIEILINYEMRLKYFSEWFKQLFAESEGKNNKGIFPMMCNFTTDLHSVGQMIQDGQKNVFETVISVENPRKDLYIKSDADNLDNLNYLSGKSVDYVNKMAMQGTLNAHLSSNVESVVVKIDEINEMIKPLLDEINSPIMSIPGVGIELGPTIISEIGDISRFDSSSKLLAYVGLDPSINQSGTFHSSFSTMSKRGSSYLRDSLFKAAFIISQIEPVFKEYYLKKKAEGKHHYVALTHVATKLVRLIFHLLKEDEVYVSKV
ncbi:MAG: transposase, partial [Finegoldia magna]|nr:transposase [Finegoldia magna]